MAFDQMDTRHILAERLNLALRDAHPTRIIEAAAENFGDRLALVSSFGTESAVLLHLVSQVNRHMPVLFLDTGMLFVQTLDYRRGLASRLGLTDVRDLRPRFEDLATGDPEAELWRSDTDACCHIRKVLPLSDALRGYEAWITGRKGFQSLDRSRTPLFEAEGERVKVNPLVGWSAGDILDYIKRAGLPPHPLVAKGFPSIGCLPCTSMIEPGEDARAGRWRGRAKTECGIHMGALTAGMDI